MRYDVIMGVVYLPVLWYRPPDKTLSAIEEIQKKDLFIHKLSELSRLVLYHYDYLNEQIQNFSPKDDLAKREFLQYIYDAVFSFLKVFMAL